MLPSARNLDLLSELLIPIGLAVVGGILIWLMARYGSQRGAGWAERNAARADRLANGVVIGLIGLYVVVIGGLALARHEALRSYAYDLGIFAQVLWNTSRGHFFENTVMVEYAGNLLGQHFAPVLLLVAPLYWIWPDPRSMILLQTVALAVGALPLYWLARRRTQSRIAAIFIAAAYLIAPAVHYVNFYDFHEIAQVTPLLFFALWYLETLRIRRLLAVLALALLCREEVGFIVAAFGIVLLFRRQWVAGAASVVVGLGWTVVSVAYVIPFFQESSDYYYVVRYRQLGNSLGEIITTVLTRPGFVFEYLTTGPRAVDRLAFLVRLAVPVGGLAVLAPAVLGLAAPTLGYLLLSDFREQYDISSQYSAPIIPIVFAAAAVAIGTLGRRTSASIGLAGFVLVASIAAAVDYGPTPIGRRHDPEQFAMTDHARLGYSVMARIPEGASVSTQGILIPHLASRREVYLFPYVHGAEYVLMDGWTTRWPLSLAQWNRARDELLANPVYELTYAEEGYELFKRKSPIPIQNPVSVSFLDTYELIGVDAPPQAVRPGERFEVALYWKPLTPIGARRVKDRFTSSVTLLNENGEPFARVDKEFWDGLLTTDLLIQGEIHRERYLLTAPDIPGTYGVAPGLDTFSGNKPLAIYVAGKRTDRFTEPVSSIRVAE